MPSPERARNDRMKLRYSPQMSKLVSSLYPKTLDILSAKASDTGSTCTPGELRAAARYLSSAMAEYNLRILEGVADARLTAMDQVLWSEDQALKSDPDDLLLRETIAAARCFRSAYHQPQRTSHGGSRYALINAIRHAWLVCHDGGDSISYRRKTKKDQTHYGALPDFIQALSNQVQYFPSLDWLHRDIRKLDLEMHPDPMP